LKEAQDVLGNGKPSQIGKEIAMNGIGDVGQRVEESTGIKNEGREKVE
jgi:hypothetical protein